MNARVSAVRSSTGCCCPRRNGQILWSTADPQRSHPLETGQILWPTLKSCTVKRSNALVNRQILHRALRCAGRGDQSTGRSIPWSTRAGIKNTGPQQGIRRRSHPFVLLPSDALRRSKTAVSGRIKRSSNRSGASVARGETDGSSRRYSGGGAVHRACAAAANLGLCDS